MPQPPLAAYILKCLRSNFTFMGLVLKHNELPKHFSEVPYHYDLILSAHA